jgi:predicted RNA-binding protein with PIN domain
VATEPIDPRHLRPALEFAVAMAAEAQKKKLPLHAPAGLDKYMRMERIPTARLGRLQVLIEEAEQFRTLIANGAVPELVDPIGMLWLQRPPGWENDLAELVADAADAERDADAQRRLKRAEKRREAAEQVAARSRAEVASLGDQLARRNDRIEALRADIDKQADTIAELRSELVDARLEVRHARDRETAATQRLERAEAARHTAEDARGAAEIVRDDVLADRAVLAAERSELARLAATAETLAEQLAALASPPEKGSPRPASKRKALPMPGGVLGDSQAAAEHLLRSGATVLVDGYNVAKLAWPLLDLEGQRVVLLDAAENVARRFGSDVTVVFDGSDVVGAAADGRRIVRVVYSPSDRIADDVIRDEVRRLPASRQVVVVTNDNEILRDVRALGANTMSSEQLIDLFH